MCYKKENLKNNTAEDENLVPSFSENIFMKNYSLKRNIPEKKEKIVTEKYTPLVKEFFEKREVVLKKFEERNREYQKQKDAEYEQQLKEVKRVREAQEQKLKGIQYQKFKTVHEQVINANQLSHSQNSPFTMLKKGLNDKKRLHADVKPTNNSKSSGLFTSHAPQTIDINESQLNKIHRFEKISLPHNEFLVLNKNAVCSN